MRKLPVAIMISGRGSNMEALIKACENPSYPARVVQVISHLPEAKGLATAQSYGINTHIVDHRLFGKDREAHELAINTALHESGAEIVCLAGYMRVLTPAFVSAWTGRLLNIHPSLLPKYPGLHTHQRALDAGDRDHGATVHLVTEGVDEGPILAQSRLQIHADDTAETLASRLLDVEHRLYPQALETFIRAHLSAGQKRSNL